MTYESYEVAAHPIKMWTHGVPVEEAAREQLRNIANLQFIHGHVAVMPDVHLGKGATVGSVIATKGAIVPAAVGVDIGCGMVAAKLLMRAEDLPDSLRAARLAIERAIPVGPNSYDQAPRPAEATWYHGLKLRYEVIENKNPAFAPKASPVVQIGTLGGGNHFIELCLDKDDGVWIMLHSGSRNIGNRIGSYFITRAREEMARLDVHLPDRDLGYLVEHGPHFDEYIEAVSWAQDYAAANRNVMLGRVIDALATAFGRPITADALAVNCHHNYVSRETHLGEACWVTRKGAVRAGMGELGIIPGSMGTRSYIVRGLGNPESFESCSHGAGRQMSRSAAKRTFTLEDHERDTAGVECRKDIGVIDETPGAYKDLDAVMAAQSDLVEIVHTLRQVLCVKG